MFTHAANSRWQWSAWEGEAFVAGCAIIHEYGARGWFVGYPGEALTSGVQLRPLIREFDLVKRLSAYFELRAWVRAGATVEERFAERFGFRLDCGPATGFGPSGEDMNLFLWRANE